MRTSRARRASSTRPSRSSRAPRRPRRRTPTAAPEEQGKGRTAGLIAAGALITGLVKELGATQEDAAATEQELADAQKQADQADKDAAAAKEAADKAAADAEKAQSETEKANAESEAAKAQADQANAEKAAAEAKATIAADCAKSYLSAFGGLFGSGNIQEQLPDVRKELEGITADCKAAFAAT